MKREITAVPEDILVKKKGSYCSTKARSEVRSKAIRATLIAFAPLEPRKYCYTSIHFTALKHRP